MPDGAGGYNRESVERGELAGQDRRESWTHRMHWKNAHQQ